MGYPREYRTNSPTSIFRHAPKRRGPSTRNQSAATHYANDNAKQPSVSEFSKFLYFISKERFERTIPQLIISHELSQMASHHAQRMADRKSVQNSSEIVLYLSRTSNRAGQNVGRAYSSEKAHTDMMLLAGDRSRIIDWGYTEVGIGTAQGSDGIIYVCELFRG
mmetsp:Transcript_2539/g.5359  ORF Transcript_2539/g.5359 Transcript_2539/m.5359 type:complete len:164 (-) Transcript_2539:274-765(-)